MKTAMEWAKEINTVANEQGGFDSVDDMAKWIEKIQLEGINHGRHQINLVLDRICEELEPQCNNPNPNVMVLRSVYRQLKGL